MTRQLTKLLPALALVGFLLPTTGCELRKGGYYDVSYTDVFFAVDWLPSFGVFDCCGYEDYTYYEESYVVTETTDYVVDDYYYDTVYYEDGYYYEEEYWDDGYWDDDW